LYTDFYKLKEKPFNLTPSPRYLYLGDVHKEALALLTYGVVERKGFILLTGEVGTGKTTVIQALLSTLDQNVHYVYLSNPVLSVSEFMDYLAFSAFRKKVHFRSKADFLVEFEGFLKACLQHQENFILLIDEAHKLSFDLLEEVRLLSNMETADEKLINIFLVGQPELNEKLSQPQCRALLQRISVRYHIKPLSFEETREYVKNRLRTAGAGNGRKIFPNNTIKSVYQYSEGFPRLINILCDNALLLGYTREKHTMTQAMIKECYDDLKLDAAKPEGNQIKKNEMPQRIAVDHSSWKGVLKWGIFLVMAFLVGLTITGKGPLIYHTLFPSRKIPEVNEQIEKAPAAPITPVKPEADEKPKELPPNVDEQTSTATPPDRDNVVPEEGQTTTPEPDEGEREGATVSTSSSPPEPAVPSPKTLIVKKGDTVTEMATTVYGFVNDALVEKIKESNPGIADLNWIKAGQKIVFPPLDRSNASPTFTVHVASFVPIERARKLFRELLDQGYDAYILPYHDAERGNLFRVTVGNFTNRAAAQGYAEKILKEGLSDYAKPIQVEVK
jgi:type II secretory pathway predicted ATPase ExeA/phage tail protein X